MNEKYIQLLEREIGLWKARVNYESALRFAACEEYDLANYTLRDIPFTEEIGLKDLSWAMHQSVHESGIGKEDWEFFAQEWFTEWVDAYRELEEAKNEL